MNDIRDWYNGRRNYKEGVALYLKHGNNAQLKRLFTAEAETPFKKEKLISAIGEILVPQKKLKSFSLHKEGPEIIKRINNLIQPAEKRWRQEDNQDDIEKALYLQWKPLFAEMMNLVARVGDVARAGTKDPSKKDEAGRMALRILELDDQCDDIYFNRDFYLKNKKLPAEEKLVDISLDPNKWHTRLESHKRYVRRFRNALDKDPSNLSAAEFLKKHEWAVGEYKKLLHIQ